MPVDISLQGEGSAGSDPWRKDDPGDRGRHKVHPNQVSTWNRWAIGGMGAVISNGADKARGDHEGEIHDLHAKIGQLTVARDFLARGLKR